jgi:hypothetical protein
MYDMYVGEIDLGDENTYGRKDGYSRRSEDVVVMIGIRLSSIDR